MKSPKGLILLLVFATGCASLPVKQKAVQGLQASEVALESAQSIERSLCFNVPSTEHGNHCTNPVAVTVKLCTAAEATGTTPCSQHQKLAQYFADAFDIEVKASTALKTWQAGEPVPTDVAGYQTDINAILALAQNLDPGAASFVAQAQLAVNSVAATLTALGVK